MKRNQLLERATLARQLEDWAACLRSGRAIRVGGAAVRVPKRVTVQTELESEKGSTELEIEVKWPASTVEATPLVGILVGSPSDLETLAPARDALTSLGVPSELCALSAHRTPDLTVEYVRGAEQRGIEVIIACAGMAAHLAGTVAAHTLLPVIGVPLGAGRLAGLDSLLSTVQMPPGVPVATVSIDGAKNAAFLAARILALKYPAVRTRLAEAVAAERIRYEKAGAGAEDRGRQHSPAPPSQPKVARRAVAQTRRRARKSSSR